MIFFDLKTAKTRRNNRGRILAASLGGTGTENTMKLNRKGFTLLEMLIVIAIVAVLISVAVPVLSSQLERSREAVDLANVRSAYAQVSTEALLGNTHVTVTVNLKQKQAGCSRWTP